MDIARSFSHMFKDSSWFFKVFIGGTFLISSIVLVGLPFIVGYIIEDIRGIAGRNESILPEWKNLRQIYKRGLVVLCAGLIYAALFVALSIAVTGKPATAVILAAILVLIFVWMPVVLIQYAKRPTFFSCFSILEIVKPCALHPFLYAESLATGFLTIAASILFGWMSMIVGWPFVIFWGILVQSQILGQLASL
jgi:Protein of unknown function (DUF4013)